MDGTVKQLELGREPISSIIRTRNFFCPLPLLWMGIVSPSTVSDQCLYEWTSRLFRIMCFMLFYTMFPRYLGAFLLQCCTSCKFLKESDFFEIKWILLLNLEMEPTVVSKSSWGLLKLGNADYWTQMKPYGTFVFASSSVGERTFMKRKLLIDSYW